MWCAFCIGIYNPLLPWPPNINAFRNPHKDSAEPFMTRFWNITSNCVAISTPQIGRIQISTSPQFPIITFWYIGGVCVYESYPNV